MRIYLDHNATTPLLPAVADAMQGALRGLHGNPSSTHAEGAAARQAVEEARAQVASILHTGPASVVFTSGATESNNFALWGVARSQRARGRHIVSSNVEHPSVEEPLRDLEAEGWRVTRLPVDRAGRLDPDAVGAALGPDTVLVSLLWAHNETGIVQPLAAIGQRVRARGVLLHVDATQAVGKVPIDLEALPVDLLSGSAHKLNGPKGAGFLYIGPVAQPAPWLRGGPQERRLRGGTHNVPGIVGLGAACEIAARELPARAARYAALRDRLWRGISAAVPGAARNGGSEEDLPNTLHVEFPDAAGDVLVEALDLAGVAVSSGAACASGSVAPSPTLTALGRSPQQARSALRFSVGEGVDAAQIDRVLEILPDLVQRVRREAAA